VSPPAAAGAAKRYAPVWIIAVAALVGALAGAALDGRWSIADGLFYDFAMPIAPRPTPTRSPQVAVIAIDRASLDSELLRRVPRVFFSPFYADLVTGLFAADAKAVGFDIVFNYSANRFPAIQRGYDRAFLEVLADNKHRVALARTAQIPVVETYAAAVFDPLRDGQSPEPAAVTYAELMPDPDGIQRWVHFHVDANDGAQIPTLVARLGAIAGAQRADAPFMLAPSEPLEALPTYGFADVLECIRRDPAAVRAAFGGKVVLVGSNLADEDRKSTVDRFLRRAEPSRAPDRGGCSLHTLAATDAPGRTAPGVHFHAAAVEQWLNGTTTRPVAPNVRIGVAAAAAAGGVAAAWLLAPLAAAGAVAVACAALFAISVLGIGWGWWLPPAVPMGLLAIAAIIGQTGRFLVVERRRKRVEQAFGRYLAPALVDRLASAVDELRLGGETRDVSVMFADLSGFTAASDTLTPENLMSVTNRYFEAMVAVVDAQDGYVDKYVGDAVMALWGAPVAVAEPAWRAADCALAVQQRVRALAQSAVDPAAPAFRVRIAVASGPAIVGNVGAPRRYNYTALGPTVNLAARLEATAKDYGVDILIDRATRDQLESRCLMCEIDAVLLKGKAAPVPVFALIAMLHAATGAQRAAVARYEQALAAMRRNDRNAAQSAFRDLASGDSGLAQAARRMQDAIGSGPRAVGRHE